MEVREENSEITLTVEEIGAILQYWEEESPINQEVELEGSITTEFEKTSIIT